MKIITQLSGCDENSIVYELNGERCVLTRTKNHSLEEMREEVRRIAEEVESRGLVPDPVGLTAAVAASPVLTCGYSYRPQPLAFEPPGVLSPGISLNVSLREPSGCSTAASNPGPRPGLPSSSSGAASPLPRYPFAAAERETPPLKAENRRVPRGGAKAPVTRLRLPFPAQSAVFPLKPVPRFSCHITGRAAAGKESPAPARNSSILTPVNANLFPRPPPSFSGAPRVRMSHPAPRRRAQPFTP